MVKRKRYTPEYRREAAALVLDTDRPIAHVAEEIGVGAQLLGRWVRQERERRDPPPSPETPLTGQEREELKQLRRRVQDRKSTRLNSSHVATSYAVFGLDKQPRSSSD